MGTPAIRTSARLGATVALTVALAATVAGCSSRSSPTSEADLVASTVTVTSSAPAASRPLSDFFDAPYNPGQYPPTPPYYSFGTPSGQIQCRVVGGTLACQTEGRSHTVADDALCGFYPGVEQGNTSRFGYFQGGPQPCATIIQGDGFNSPHTLAYGESVSAELPSGRTVTCTSAVEGLTCTEAGGTEPRGFFLSVDTFTLL
jgi:hypothetical protein